MSEPEVSSSVSAASTPKPSLKGLVPCLIGGPLLAGLIFLVVPKLVDSDGGIETLGKLLLAALEGVFAFIALVLTLSPSLLMFIVLSTLLVCGCGLFKYRHAEDTPLTNSLISRLVNGLLVSMLLSVVMFFVFIETKNSRAAAFSEPGPVSESVASFDARPREGLHTLNATGKLSWRERQFAEGMNNDYTAVSYFGYPNCRRIVNGYRSSPAAGLYHVEVNGRVLDASTPTSVCSVFNFSRVELTKLK